MERNRGGRNVPQKPANPAPSTGAGPCGRRYFCQVRFL